MSSRGISRIGNSEVAGIGIASVDHQTAISAARPTVSHAFSETPPGGSVRMQASNSSGPRIRPIHAASTAPRL